MSTQRLRRGFVSSTLDILLTLQHRTQHCSAREEAWFLRRCYQRRRQSSPTTAAPAKRLRIFDGLLSFRGASLRLLLQCPRRGLVSSTAPLKLWRLRGGFVS